MDGQSWARVTSDLDCQCARALHVNVKSRVNDFIDPVWWFYCYDNMKNSEFEFNKLKNARYLNSTPQNEFVDSSYVDEPCNKFYHFNISR